MGSSQIGPITFMKQPNGPSEDPTWRKNAPLANWKQVMA
jgi:hypothetical protein